MRLSAVIFDLDGTLVDSEGNYFESDKKFVTSLGGVYDNELRSECIGMGSKAFCELIKDRYQLNQSVADLLTLKDQCYLDVARGKTKVFPEMLKLVRAFALENLPMAVASGSSLSVIQEVLVMTGLKPYFSHVFSSESVAYSKPAPDIFLYTAKMMGYTPEDILVFEDSKHGLAAGRAAGMRVIAVPTFITLETLPLFKTADLLFESGMQEFTAEAVLDWIDAQYCQCDDCTLYDFGRCHDPANECSQLKE